MPLQRRPTDNDESVMLFVLMKTGKKFSRSLVNDIKAAIRKELSPRHVPRYIFETPDIPVSMASITILPYQLTLSDNREPQESRVACETDRIRQDHQAKWHSAKPRKFKFLLQIRKGRGAGRSTKGEVVI